MEVNWGPMGGTPIISKCVGLFPGAVRLRNVHRDHRHVGLYNLNTSSSLAVGHEVRSRGTERDLCVKLRLLSQFEQRSTPSCFPRADTLQLVHPQPDKTASVKTRSFKT